MRQGEGDKYIYNNSEQYTSYRHRLVCTSGIQGDFKSCADILTMSYWLHAELGKIFKKFSVKK
jgi:hypothetical protein